MLAKAGHKSVGAQRVATMVKARAVRPRCLGSERLAPCFAGSAAMHAAATSSRRSSAAGRSPMARGMEKMPMACGTPVVTLRRPTPSVGAAESLVKAEVDWSMIVVNSEVGVPDCR